MGARAFVIPSIFTAVDRTSAVMERIQSRLERMNNAMSKVGKYATVGAVAMTGALTMAANSAIEFQDKLADVAKTTGLEGKGLESYGNSILNLAATTRSSIDDIVQIGVIGGQLGIAQENLQAFTEQANKFAVALGGDYSGGVEEAISQVGKLNLLFRDMQGFDPAKSLNIAGSMINDLTNMGVTAQNVNDFALRLGKLPDAMKPSLQSTLALAATFEKLGVNSEVASSGFSNLILIASKDIGKFAARMGVSAGEAQKLLQLDPVKFAARFAKSFKGMNAVQLGKTLKDLKLNSNEVIGAVGALASGGDVLSEALQRANEQYEKGNSLANEYATKNSTVAAKMAIAKNNFQVLAITVGTELLPVVTELLNYLTPLLKWSLNFVKENPRLVKAMVVLTGVLWGVVAVTKAWAVASAIASAAMWANPITWIVAGILLLIGVLITAIAYWDEFGAGLLALMGPFGWLINTIMAFKKHWDSIVNAFNSGGILKGIQRIGQVLIDAVLTPLEQIIGALSRLPGLGFLKSINSTGAIGTLKTRYNLYGDEGGNTDTSNKAIIPVTQMANALAMNSIAGPPNGKVEIVVKGDTDKVKVKETSGNNSVKISPMNWGGV